MYFTMKRKVRKFLETTFKIYDVSKEKIEEAIEFVSKFDFNEISLNVINNLFIYLESRI